MCVDSPNALCPCWGKLVCCEKCSHHRVCCSGNFWLVFVKPCCRAIWQSLSKSPWAIWNPKCKKICCTVKLSPACWSVCPAWDQEIGSFLVNNIGTITSCQKIAVQCSFCFCWECLLECITEKTEMQKHFDSVAAVVLAIVSLTKCGVKSSGVLFLMSTHPQRQIWHLLVPMQWHSFLHWRPEAPCTAWFSVSLLSHLTTLLCLVLSHLFLLVAQAASKLLDDTIGHQDVSGRFKQCAIWRRCLTKQLHQDNTVLFFPKL